jgi:hypothetical protein
MARCIHTSLFDLPVYDDLGLTDNACLITYLTLSTHLSLCLGILIRKPVLSCFPLRKPVYGNWPSF